MHPLSRGGLHEEWNVAPMCFEHNRSKGSKTLAEWLGDRDGATAHDMALRSMERAMDIAWPFDQARKDEREAGRG